MEIPFQPYLWHHHIIPLKISSVLRNVKWKLFQLKIMAEYNFYLLVSFYFPRQHHKAEIGLWVNIVKTFAIGGYRSTTAGKKSEIFPPRRYRMQRFSSLVPIVENMDDYWRTSSSTTSAHTEHVRCSTSVNRVNSMLCFGGIVYLASSYEGCWLYFICILTREYSSHAWLASWPWGIQSSTTSPEGFVATQPRQLFRVRLQTTRKSWARCFIYI